MSDRAKLSAYHRWEMASLDAQPAAAEAAAAAAQANALAAARAAAVAEGLAQGRAQAAAERDQLDRLVTRLGTQVADHEQRLVDEVLDLALVFARQLVGEALAVRRDVIVPIVRTSLRQLPQSTQRVELVLNPADAGLVRDYLPQDTLAGRCTIVEDPTVAPGGCRVETEQCEIDATIATRWRRLLAGMGRDDGWIEPV